MKKFRLKEYIFLFLFVLTNSAIIFESSLPASVSSQRSNFFTNVASFIINGVLPDQKPEIISVTGLEVKDNNAKLIGRNSSVEIPLGVTRKFTTDVFPIDATNKTVFWVSYDTSAVRVTSGGYLEARKLANNIQIVVTTVDQNIVHRFFVDVVPKSAPTNFAVVLEDDVLEVGRSTTLKINLSEKDKREYDPTKLVYWSSNHHVASINSYGIIKALGVGTTTIYVSNHDTSYNLEVVANTSPVIAPTSLTLTGPVSGYVYGYTPLSVAFDREDVTDQNVVFTSSNEAIATVSESGVVYGTKVSGVVTITAYARTDFSVYDEFDLQINDVVPSSLTLAAVKTEVNVAKKITITPTLTHSLSDQTLPVTNQEVLYTSSNTEVAGVVSLNGNGIVLGVARGSVIITASSVANPNLTSEITIEVLPLEVINEGNIREFGAYIRKALGHFSLFFVNGLFGALTFYYLFNKKKVLNRLLLSLVPGFFIAGLSEFIQIFVEGRGATLYDVLIDSAGYVFAVVLVYLFLLIRAKRQKKTPTVIDV